MKAYKQVITAIIGINIFILFGTIGFVIIEDISFFDSLWMTVITVLTVGYGDMVPETREGRLFALFITPIGVGFVTYGLGAVAATIINGKLSNTVWRKRMERSINKLDNHIILCGLGRVGLEVLTELKEFGKQVVVIENAIEVVEEADKDFLYIIGNATDDDILYKAGIERASGLIATLPKDADNVFVSLTAKGMNPNILVVSRAEKFESEEKLRRAGADKVINPAYIGGHRIAMSLVKPTSVEYFERILQSNKKEFSVEELYINPKSIFINETLKDSAIRSKYGITIVGIKRGDDIISNPVATEVLKEGDLVIVFGTKDQLNGFEKAVKP